MKIDKNLWPIIAGMIAMFFWATMLCIVSSLYSPLGDCAGIHVGHYTIGKVSRYLDPFLLGVLVAFAIFAWQHQPPSFSWNKVGNFNKMMSTEGEISTGFVASIVLFFSLFFFYELHFGRNNTPIIFLFYLVILISPFGWRGVTIPVVAITLIFWLSYGLPVAMIFFFATWLGKWAIWWLINIVKLGCRDTLMKLKGQHSPDHGSEGTDVPQELSL